LNCDGVDRVQTVAISVPEQRFVFVLTFA